MQRPLTPRSYLVVFAIVVAVLATTGLYLRYRAQNAAVAAAICDTPAPPPKPAAPPPKLPGFELEAGCGVAPAKPPGK